MLTGKVRQEEATCEGDVVCEQVAVGVSDGYRGASQWEVGCEAFEVGVTVVGIRRPSRGSWVLGSGGEDS